MPSERDAIELAEVFASVARVLATAADEKETLQRIVNLAVGTIDRCDWAGVMLVEGERITTPASSNGVPVVVNSLQLALGEGPCLEAIRHNEIVAVPDLAEDTRWPRFARRAVEEVGVRTMLSYRLHANRDTVGSLSLYSKGARAFHHEDEALGAVFAAHASVALTHAREAGQLREALAARDTIGKAKGFLMARAEVSDDAAFDMLRKASQRLNVKLRDVAQRVLDTREPPHDLQ